MHMKLMNSFGNWLIPRILREMMKGRKLTTIQFAECTQNDVRDDVMRDAKWSLSVTQI